jgi:hypothetical protein
MRPTLETNQPNHAGEAEGTDSDRNALAKKTNQPKEKDTTTTQLPSIEHP